MPTENRPATIRLEAPKYPDIFYRFGNMLDCIEAAQFEIDALMLAVLDKCPGPKPLTAVARMMHHAYEAHRHMLSAYSQRFELPDLQRLGAMVQDGAARSRYAGPIWDAGEAVLRADQSVAELMRLLPTITDPEGLHWARKVESNYRMAAQQVGRTAQAAANTTAPILAAYEALGFHSPSLARN